MTQIIIDPTQLQDLSQQFYQAANRLEAEWRDHTDRMGWIQQIRWDLENIPVTGFFFSTLDPLFYLIDTNSWLMNSSYPMLIDDMRHLAGQLASAAQEEEHVIAELIAGFAHSPILMRQYAPKDITPPSTGTAPQTSANLNSNQQHASPGNHTSQKPASTTSPVGNQGNQGTQSTSIGNIIGDKAYHLSQHLQDGYRTGADGKPTTDFRYNYKFDNNLGADQATVDKVINGNSTWKGNNIECFAFVTASLAAVGITFSAGGDAYASDLAKHSSQQMLVKENFSWINGDQMPRKGDVIVMTGGEIATDDTGKAILDSQGNPVRMGHVAVITSVTGIGTPTNDPSTGNAVYSNYNVQFANSNATHKTPIWVYNATNNSWSGVWKYYNVAGYYRYTPPHQP